MCRAPRLLDYISGRQAENASDIWQGLQGGTSMSDIIRAVQFGCGPIGVAVGSLAARRSDIELVGALDVDPEKVGKDFEIYEIDFGPEG